MLKKPSIRHFLALFLFICSSSLSLTTNANDRTFTNPILAGGFPDPSICRQDDTFYMVNSSFEYFPGLPIHQSKDLVNWQLIGHGLHREEQVTDQVNLVDVQSDGGIHAPTIRCHNGKFYIITTNVYLPEQKDKPVEFVNFIITADNPAGPWSKPHVLAGAPGIDPDIFFDDNGKVWYVGTHSPEKPNFAGEGEIWLQEIDLDNWTLTGKRHFLWRGACGGVWAEGPHLYKRDGRYYLMVAEGGTSFNHAMVIAVSGKITGSYYSNPRNPLLTTRQLSYDNWVNSTGHADIVELEDGRFYMVALGIRGDEQRKSNMGRETFLLPVSWEREPFEWQEIKYEWLVVAPLTGRVERQLALPFPGKPQFRKTGFSDNFDHSQLKLEWSFRRFPNPNTYSLGDNTGSLRLFALPEVIKDRGRASLLGFRQTESDFAYQAKMQFNPQKEKVEAGISLFQKDDNYIAFTVEKTRNKVQLKLVVVEPNKQPKTVKAIAVEQYQGEIIFAVDSQNGRYQYRYSIDNGRSFVAFAETSSTLILSRKYTGANLGIYATSNGQSSDDYADFDWVKYTGFERH